MPGFESGRVISGTVSHEALRDAILTLRDRWIKEGEAPSAYEINNGLCEDFAQAVIAELGGESETLSMYWGDEFTLDGYEWDAGLLARHWPGSVPTHGLDWGDLRGFVPVHAWIIFEGRHYDAECPEGVDNLFELPLVRRGMEFLAAANAEGFAAR